MSAGGGGGFLSSQPLVDKFSEDMMAVVERYYDQGLTVAEAVGAIEMVKLEVFMEQTDRNEEPF